MTRDEKGRFLQGNPGGGRKPRAVEESYLELFKSTVSQADAVKIIEKAKTDAIAGDAVARKFIFDYLVGTPVQKVAPTTPDGENPYMSMETADLLDLVRKIASATNPPD